MITQFEVHFYFKQQLPGLLNRRNISRKTSPTHLSAKASILAFAEYTAAMLLQGNDKKTGECLKIAEQLYLQGDVVVRMLIENSYIALYASYVVTRQQKQRWIRLIPEKLIHIFNYHAGQFSDAPGPNIISI
jgi:hypothetical protein